MVWSVVTGRLTLQAAITGGVIGMLLFAGTGWMGVLLMTAFFVMGSFASAWKRQHKEMIGVAEANRGKRKTSQVWANAGLAGLMALVAWRFPSFTGPSRFLIACCFSSAAADTLSSELGSVYGKKFFNILSFKKDRNGLDGVVSAEGFLFGLAGSMVIALLFLLFKGSSHAFPWILVAGTAGNLADSLFGAAWERKGRMGNDTVNFLNTLTAAVVGYLLYLS
jgi:uncharacterized protein (TIGR00297 family)